MSFIEKRIESTLHDGIVSAYTAGGYSDMDVRTFFAEPTYSEGDEKMKLPMTWIMASPCSKPVGSEPFRECPVQIDIRSHYNDDYDRNTLSDMYRVVRKCIEETDWDFGSGIVVHEYEMPSAGSADIDDQLQYVSINIIFKLCATNFDL